MTSAAAFFDFDNTLLAADSAKIGIRYLWERGHIPRAYMAGLLFRNFFYKRNLYPIERLAPFLITFYKGRRLEVFEEGVGEFYAECLKPKLSPRLLPLVEEHRARGRRLVILSASVRYMLRMAAEDLRFDHLLCTDLETGPDGFLTGRSQGPICVGTNKRRAAEALAAAEGIDLAQSYAYGDHHSDLPMLEMVGHPAAVSPSPRLRRAALKRGWPIIEER